VASSNRTPRAAASTCAQSSNRPATTRRRACKNFSREDFSRDKKISRAGIAALKKYSEKNFSRK
jgi:hypothetical protein